MTEEHTWWLLVFACMGGGVRDLEGFTRPDLSEDKNSSRRAKVKSASKLTAIKAYDPLRYLEMSLGGL